MLKPDYRNNYRSGSGTSYRKPSDSEAAPLKHKPTEKPPPFKDVLTKQSILNLILYTLLALHMIGYDQTLPVSVQRLKRVEQGIKLNRFSCITPSSPLTTLQSTHRSSSVADLACVCAPISLDVSAFRVTTSLTLTKAHNASVSFLLYSASRASFSNSPPIRQSLHVLDPSAPSASPCGSALSSTLPLLSPRYFPKMRNSRSFSS